MLRKKTLRWVAPALMVTYVVGCGSGSSTPGSGDTTSGGTTVTDPDTLADQKADALLAQMTQDEKLQLTHGAGFGASTIGGAGIVKGISRLGIPDIISADSAGGVNVSGVNATPLPAPINVASSWDPQLAHDYGALIATELRVLGFTEGLGGGIDLAREPRNGRTFEYMGEDPVLAGTLSAQRVIGTQEQKVIATVKHYAMNDQETNRSTSNSEVDERTMRELHLLQFEISVKDGRPGNVMCAYNLVNGLKSCENPYLITDVLKKEWGFRGTVQSDWVNAIDNAIQAATAGADEEEPGESADSSSNTTGFSLKSYFAEDLGPAVAAGSVPQSRLDDMAFRHIRTLYRLGIMDDPLPTTSGTIDTAAGDAVALKVAQQSMVLLKNATATGDTAAVLPLSASTTSKIVVVGGHADAGVISGGGSGGTPARDGSAVTCTTSGSQSGAAGSGSSCATWYKSSPLAAIKAKAPNATVTYYDCTDTSAAASAAAAADIAIVFATQYEAEGTDLSSLSLPDSTVDPANVQCDQNAVIAAVSAVAKRTVVVLENGSPVTMPWVSSVHGVLETWYPGVQGGPAIASVLFGDINPSGKLPITFPASEADLPQKTISATDLNVQYSEGLEMGYRWYDAQQITPLFPFGYGLSYTSFTYTGVKTSTDSSGNVTVSFTLTNSGSRDGAEVAQVYAGLPSNSGEPPKRLVGWQKVTLAAGASQAMSITIASQRLAIWDVSNHSWQVPSGSFTFYAGGSSRSTQSLVSTQRLKGRSVASTH
jgi:beta-glucosidase